MILGQVQAVSNDEGGAEKGKADQRPQHGPSADLFLLIRPAVESQLGGSSAGCWHGGADGANYE